MYKTLFFTLSFLLVGSLVATQAYAGEYKCPEKITTTGTQVVAVAGFEGWDDPQVPAFVTGINLYDGHPKGMAQLKPDNAEDPNEGDGSVWTLPDSPSGFWMVCTYSDTNARVTRQIDSGEKFCAVKDIRGPEDASPSGGAISLECH
jgi:hypothetical protein